MFLDRSSPTDPRVALSSLGDPGGAREVTSLTCHRVYYAAGSGVCLATQGLLAQGIVRLLDGRLRPTGEVSTVGLPSRARVANSGRYASTTTFTAGDSYAAVGFSTRTQLIDLEARVTLYDLESITVRRDGAVFSHQDFNFWGVTFAPDGDRYYATLGTQGATYLVAGSIKGRTAEVLLQGVECPSLSPDGTRIAFKEILEYASSYKGIAIWRPAMLDLRTMQVTPITSESRSVDDQIEWLDNDEILYSIPHSEGGSPGSDIWALRADGGGQPRLFIPNASSPAVVRGPAPQPAP